MILFVANLIVLGFAIWCNIDAHRTLKKDERVLRMIRTLWAAESSMLNRVSGEVKKLLTELCDDDGEEWKNP